MSMELWINAYSMVISLYAPLIITLEHSHFQLRQAKGVQPGYNNIFMDLMPTSPKGLTEKKAFQASSWCTGRKRRDHGDCSA